MELEYKSSGASSPLTFTSPSRLLYLKVSGTDLNLIFWKSVILIYYKATPLYLVQIFEAFFQEFTSKPKPFYTMRY